MIAGPLAQEALERAEVDTAARAIDAVIRDGGPDIVYQPIVDLDLGEPVGYEALSRFRNGEAPDRWFSRAAAAGRTVDLEIAAIRAALRGLPCLPEAVYVAVNASETTLLSPALTAALAGVPPERLVLELTEHVAVEDTTALVAHLAPLRASGVRLAVDDTGSGYAGLQQLLGLRPDILKIDGELTREVASDPARQALAWALAWFARKTGACLIAEGIETSEDMETLRSVGVQHGQGYHLGRPAPLAQILYSRITA
jgi:EAL domain-containing protein (putative c-di-GMP-specific phosphodiesterase class I)